MDQSHSNLITARTILILGGARSGKTGYALGLAAQSRGERLYIATSEPGDEEMRERIGRHRQERGDTWRTIEEPIDIHRVVREESAPGRIILLDCITLWLSNLSASSRDIDTALASLISSIQTASGPVVLISNEVGMGIVPATSLGREFRDWQGRANQRIAAACEAVTLMYAGIPVILKPGVAQLRLAS